MPPLSMLCAASSAQNHRKQTSPPVRASASPLLPLPCHCFFLFCDDLRSTVTPSVSSRTTNARLTLFSFSLSVHPLSVCLSVCLTGFLYRWCGASLSMTKKPRVVSVSGSSGSTSSSLFLLLSCALLHLILDWHYVFSTQISTLMLCTVRVFILSWLTRGRAKTCVNFLALYFAFKQMTNTKDLKPLPIPFDLVCAENWTLSDNLGRVESLVRLHCTGQPLTTGPPRSTHSRKLPL